MEADRGCVLIIDAAVEGLIDYRQARLGDGKWWRRLGILTNALARQKNLATVEAGYRYYLAQLSNGSLTTESYKKAQQEAADRYHDLLGQIKPWQGKDFIARKNKEITGYRQQYIDAFGVDPTDLGFKEWEAREIQRAEDEHQARMRQENVTNPDVIIAERQREAELKRLAKLQRTSRRKGK